MGRPFKILRCIMHEHDYTQQMLGEELGLTQCSVSHRMNAHVPWSSDEMWHIMELFHVPAKRLHEVFPSHGVTET
jgi:hypothetical protein